MSFDNFDDRIFKLNDKLNLSQLSNNKGFCDKFFDSKLFSNCWVVLDQIFVFEKWFSQKVNYCYWFLRVTIHFDVLFKHYEFVSKLIVLNQQLLQILPF